MKTRKPASNKDKSSGRTKDKPATPPAPQPAEAKPHWYIQDAENNWWFDVERNDIA